MVLFWGEMFWPNKFLPLKLSSFLFLKLSHLFERISKVISIAIVSERIIAVMMPFRVKIICRPTRIAVVIVMIYIVTFATSLPNVVDVFMHHYKINSNGTTYSHKPNAEKYRSKSLSKSAFRPILYICNLLAFDFLPIPVVMVSNIIIIIWLRNGDGENLAINEVQQQRKFEERQITKLLLTISILFLVLCGPSGIYAFLFFTKIHVSSMNPTMVLVVDILATLNLLNSSINFVVYAAMNTKYRAGYKAILCCFKQRRNDASNSSLPQQAGQFSATNRSNT